MTKTGLEFSILVIVISLDFVICYLEFLLNITLCHFDSAFHLSWQSQGYLTYSLGQDFWLRNRQGRTSCGPALSIFNYCYKSFTTTISSSALPTSPFSSSGPADTFSCVCQSACTDGQNPVRLSHVCPNLR